MTPMPRASPLWFVLADSLPFDDKVVVCSVAVSPRLESSRWEKKKHFRNGLTKKHIEYSSNFMIFLLSSKGLIRISRISGQVLSVIIFNNNFLYSFISTV